MKKVLCIYDDREKPAAGVKSITGEKSFGECIYKRRTFFELTREYIPSLVRLEEMYGQAQFKTNGTAPSGIAFPGDKDTAVFHIFSSAAIRDEAGLKLLLEKAKYVNDSYVARSDGAIMLIIFNSLSDWLDSMRATEEGGADALKTAVSDLPEINGGNQIFSNLADRDEFVRFVTGSFEARFFNSVSGDRNTVVKKSENKEKLKAEHDFYRMLPDEMKPWFVMPYDYADNGTYSSYKMERMHMTDLAIRYVHGAISMKEFEGIMEQAFRFLRIRSRKTVSWNDYFEKRKELYIDKVEKRIDDLKKNALFPKIESFLKNGTDFEDIDSVIKRYEELYDREAGKKKEELYLALSHGDLCFSNILYSPESELMRLIDPKGGRITGAPLNEDADKLYMDPYYDVAKLSHSIVGGYDFMNSGLYEIRLNDSFSLSLHLDGDRSAYTECFKSHLDKEGFDFFSVRLFECSLFLSMLPLHMDRPHKVMAFLLNAIGILDELYK